MAMRWFKRKSKAVVVAKPELTAAEKAANAAAELQCWRYSNPVKSYRVTFRDGTHRDVRCYYFVSGDGVWTDFEAWAVEGWSGRYDRAVTVFRCRTDAIDSIELKDPLPEALVRV